MRLPHTAYATFASLILLLFLSACSAFLHKGAKQRQLLQGTVQLHVDMKNPDSLKKTGRLACPESRPQGCIRVPRLNTAQITFRLPKGSAWHLTKFTLWRNCGENRCALTDSERHDFEFTACGMGNPLLLDDKGEVDLTRLDANLKEFVLKDRNIVDQDYKYEIEACDADNNCTTMDPPLENEGLN